MTRDERLAIRDERVAVALAKKTAAKEERARLAQIKAEADARLQAR